ncbi:MAG: hypothetical protein H6713_27365 [Myxococcales bacterium]|nr:hypothetical protein [Myxococcales bacterium]
MLPRSVAARTLAVGLGLLALALSAPASAGRLDDVRKETGGGSSGSSGSSGSGGSGGSGGAVAASIGRAIGAAIGEAMAEAIADVGRRVRYRPFPYADHRVGFSFLLPRPVDEELSVDDERDDDESDDDESDDDELAAEPQDPSPVPIEDVIPERGRVWSLNLGLEGAFLPADTVRGGFSTRVLVSLFELNSSWSYLHEFDIRDRLVLGDINIGFSGGSRYVHAHFGVGPSFMIDPSVPDISARTLVGVNYVSARLEVFPKKPLVLKLGADAGRLRAADYWRLRASLGATIGKLELFAGYEHLQVGAVPLGGPMVGVVVWI